MSCQGRGALESYKTKLNKRKTAFTTTKTSGNGVIGKNAKMALNLSDVIHDEIGLNLYRGSVLQ
jgi:hypothetical protein